MTITAEDSSIVPLGRFAHYYVRQWIPPASAVVDLPLETDQPRLYHFSNDTTVLLSHLTLGSSLNSEAVNGGIYTLIRATFNKQGDSNVFGSIDTSDVRQPTAVVRQSANENFTLPFAFFWSETVNGQTSRISFIDLNVPSVSTIQYQFWFGPPNPSGPQFPPGKYSATISPNTAVNSNVLGVAATDRDGDNTTYALYGGNGIFDIHPTSGIIRLAQTIPPGSTKFCLNVAASDNRAPPQTAVVPVEIIVDGAQNSPGECNIFPDWQSMRPYVQSNRPDVGGQIDQTTSRISVAPPTARPIPPEFTTTSTPFSTSASIPASTLGSSSASASTSTLVSPQIPIIDPNAQNFEELVR